MTNLNKEIGQRLADLRNNLHMSQKDVVINLQLLGVYITNKALSKYEKGDTAAPLEVLIGLSDLYHADMNYITKGEKANALCPDLKLKEMAKSSKMISDFFATLVTQL